MARVARAASRYCSLVRPKVAAILERPVSSIAANWSDVEGLESRNPERVLSSAMNASVEGLGTEKRSRMRGACIGSDWVLYIEEYT